MPHITQWFTVPFTLVVNGTFDAQQGCAMRDFYFGRGQNTGLGWSDPTFWALSRPKRP